MTNEQIIKMYVAQCKICLVAKALRCCDKCAFNVGLKAQEPKPEPKPVL